MKVSVEAYGTVYAIEKEADDLTTDEFVDVCVSLALAMGYSPRCVDEAFGIRDTLSDAQD